MKKEFLTLALLLPLSGCWDSGCCKKNNEITPIGQQATPIERCTHIGCTHDHGHNVHHDHYKQDHETQHDQKFYENNQTDAINNLEIDEK